ncbi:hypothetical protein RHSIM_Rhsim08G0076700 [Rhododendron simsii]|uniref:K-box domain-containing protein n=1 Tax=Rhododendron simsii TaxID=118357 RepID=A0A834GNN3_RHOSS|nr:hypothetical protein RHSIM_Rhsim08G0076700 [Rhododendron simsii]
MYGILRNVILPFDPKSHSCLHEITRLSSNVIDAFVIELYGFTPNMKYLVMAKTLERYQKCSYETLEVNHHSASQEMEQSSYREYLKLKGKHEALQRYQRQLLGEDLGPLNIKELENLEHQLETSLKQIRTIKTQSMLDQLYDLQTKEQLWTEANKGLERKLDEIYRENHLQSAWACGEQSTTYGHPQHHPQSQGFFQPLECNSNLQIGYNPQVSNQITAATTQDQNVSGLIPGWML